MEVSISKIRQLLMTSYLELYIFHTIYVNPAQRYYVCQVYQSISPNQIQYELKDGFDILK